MKVLEVFTGSVHRKLSIPFYAAKDLVIDKQQYLPSGKKEVGNS